MAEEEKTGISEEEAAEQAKKFSRKVSEDDVADMVGKEDKMKGFFKNVEALKKYWDDVCDVFALLGIVSRANTLRRHGVR
jgi:tetrahydromethanopterin S-methyltransferase subunit H